MRAEELNATLRKLAERYAETAREVLGENLLSVALFGSVARGGGWALLGYRPFHRLSGTSQGDVKEEGTSGACEGEAPG